MKLGSILTITALLATLPSVATSRAATIYSDLRDIAIPSNFNGVFLDLDTGTTGTSSFTGWDINPFFGGVAIGNSPAFQPVRLGTSPLDRVLNLAPGTVISSSLTYASGFGGSGNIGHEHLGPGSDQFQPGTEGYLGFKFTTNENLGPLYGWMRLTLMNNAAGAVIKDWGYDDSGATIAIGRVQQSAPSGGSQVVSLSPGAGESFALGSAITDTGGNTNNVIKTGSGTTTLAATSTFTGTTTLDDGTLEISTGALANTAAITVNSGATLLLGGPSQDRVNDTAAASLNGGRITLTGSIIQDEQIGSLNLQTDSIIDFGTFLGGHTLRFADSSAMPWVAGQSLSIWNWTQDADHVFFGTGSGGLTSSQLAQISFYSSAGSGFLGTGTFGSFGEVTPVPEPSAIIVAAALCGLAGWFNRPRRKQ